ncbi:Hypothetical protein R9X50_00358400 [Acrodontium crateriforme]|uniref:Major facilitator superfamily (MFS) profile domain-containing protein n=1 Tax=Acrodontium crateriforme TaxID=150365 RepID=A0AAQ3M386_9PEZI|nr:Hypothetical protein R9X50_00358400 [Acrodontium crateriforme]
METRKMSTEKTFEMKSVEEMAIKGLGVPLEPNAEVRVELGPKAMAATMTALCLSILLAALDQTIVTTALPVISQHFGSSTGYIWVGSAYVLLNASCAPAWGKISDNFGRKPMLLLAVATFLAGSLICGLAINIKMLVGGRAVQGCGGGGITVLSTIIISDLVPIGKRSMYFALVGIVWAFASSIGPVVSWRWCFFINLPVGGFSMLVLWFFLKLKTPTTNLIQGLKAIDWIGTFLVLGGTVMFLIGLDVGGVIFPWASPQTLCLLIFGVFAWILFLLNERYLAEEPLMPLVLFSNRQSNFAFAICFVHGLLFIAGPYYLPLYFQSVLLASPIKSGVYLSPYLGALSAASFATSFWIRKTGKYLLAIRVGLFLTVLGHGLLINLPLGHLWGKIIVYLMIAGAGIGPNFQSPLIALQNSVDDRHIAPTTATFGFVRNLATSISIAVGGVIFQNYMEAQFTPLQEVLGTDLALKLSGSGAASHVGLIATLPESARVVVEASFLSGLQKLWIFYTGVCGIAIIVSVFMKEKQLKNHF